MLSLCHQPYEMDAIKLIYNLCPLSPDSSLKSVGVTEWSIIDVEVTGEMCPPSPIERKEGLVCTISNARESWFYDYILSYGPYARVIEPEKIQNKVHTMIKEMK